MHLPVNLRENVKKSTCRKVFQYQLSNSSFVGSILCKIFGKQTCLSASLLSHHILVNIRILCSCDSSVLDNIISGGSWGYVDVHICMHNENPISSPKYQLHSTTVHTVTFLPSCLQHGSPCRSTWKYFETKCRISEIQTLKQQTFFQNTRLHYLLRNIHVWKSEIIKLITVKKKKKNLISDFLPC